MQQQRRTASSHSPPLEIAEKAARLSTRKHIIACEAAAPASWKDTALQFSRRARLLFLSRRCFAYPPRRRFCRPDHLRLQSALRSEHLSAAGGQQPKEEAGRNHRARIALPRKRTRREMQERAAELNAKPPPKGTHLVTRILPGLPRRRLLARTPK
ncbi:uncharacterized protein LOC142775722 [Rhipicephalus microplus]|uniref:uncharacterized protein LOC142775722 n=1 Tax=Rhipicephalus microplus TaxID=6941 RepID=UPI003F6A77A3